MGLLDMMGAGNTPFGNWVKANPYSVRGLGQAVAGIGQGMVGHGSDTAGVFSGINDALAAKAGPLGEMAKMQQDYTQQQQEVAQAQAQQNQTVKWLQQKGYSDLADAITMGYPVKDALAEGIARSQPQAPVDPTTTVAGRQQLGQQMGLNGDALTSYVLTGKLPDAPKAPSIPASYQEYLLGKQDPDYAKTLASSSSKPPTDQDVRMAKLTEVVAPDIELLTKEVAPGKTVYDSLADGGNQFWNGIDIGGAKPAYGFTSPEYQQAQAALSNIAQSYLYAISGQAAPEGEVRKIVDSVTPKPFESKASIDEKKRRLATYVEAIKMSKYDAAGAMRGDAAIPGASGRILIYNPATGELE